jgi:hypothetical protein
VQLRLSHHPPTNPEGVPITKATGISQLQSNRRSLTKQFEPITFTKIPLQDSVCQSFNSASPWSFSFEDASKASIEQYTGFRKGIPLISGVMPYLQRSGTSTNDRRPEQLKPSSFAKPDLKIHSQP